MKNRLLPIIGILLGFMISSAALFAQIPENEPLYFQNYTIEDGLPDNWFWDITQDEQGYMWFATASGVSRFDGYIFENFLNDPENSTSLSSNDARTILSDRDNQIWIGTILGLNRFDRSSRIFHRFQHDPLDPNSLPGNEIVKLFESQNGTLWIITTRGLAAFEPNSQSFRRFTIEEDSEAQLNHTLVTSITESADGLIWIGTAGDGIRILNPETGEITWLRHDPDDPNSIPGDEIFNLFIDRDQVLWVSYDGREDKTDVNFTEYSNSNSYSGLWKKDLVTGTVHHYLYNPERGHPLWGNVSNFEQKRDGKLWISQLSGIIGAVRLYDVSSDAFIEYQYESNNPGTIAWNYVTSHYIDRFNHLWVATSRGLSRADQNQIQMSSFTPIPENQHNPLNNFYGIAEVGHNRFWISGDIDGTVIDWDRNRNTWELLPDFIPNKLPVVLKGKNKGWILFDQRTIQRLNLQTFEMTAYVLSGSADRENIIINHFLSLPDDNFLVATNEGLWKLDVGSGSFIKTEFASPFAHDEILNIPYLSIDSSGKVWLAVNNAYLDTSGSKKGILLASYDSETGITEFPDIDNTYMDALGNGSANHLFFDSRGQLWVSKTNGVVQFDPETNNVSTYNQNKGLRHLIVLGTLEDDEGMIWFTTRYGISRLNPTTGTIRNFGRDDGLRPARMNNFSFYKRENGELLFGGVGGLSYFQPKDIPEADETPLIHLVNMEAAETTVNLHDDIYCTEAVKINWNSNSINIEFVSVNFRNPGETTYIYKLEGFHDSWVEAGTRRFVQFSNLPPKTYTFHVKAVNADGITSTEPASVSFVILPPWWRTWWAYSFYLILFVAGIVAVDRVQRRRVLQKEREKTREKELEQAKEIEKAYQNLEVAHENLKSTQTQLIHSEKMASLGELTAGIAHEIQNPLNFVNNFSEVSNELLHEMNEELDKGEIAEAKAISADIRQNLEKINHHGKRADAIVKGMLQHSRTSNGVKEPTDINALADEYLRLSYHGLRAKDKSFNAEFKTEFDPNLPKINVIPQDIGRVILNLINNAFYAVSSKALETGDSSYKPEVIVATKNHSNFIELSVKDNGPGIPAEIKDKIFQPFFTTKPTGQGTGLGLSLSYDIVKAHGGELKVETKVGGGSEFIIEIPVT